MLNFHRLCYDPDSEPGIGEAIMAELETQEKEPAETPAAAEAEKPAEPQAWDKVERRKGYEGEKRRAADKPPVVDADPETELDFEFEAGKGKAKMKLSELRDTAKWIHENKGTLSSMLKHREMVTKFPEFGKIMNTVIEKSFTGNELNKDFVSNTLATLEGKKEKIEDKLEDKDELIEEMHSQLEDLDPESPQAQILKKSIVYQKGLKAELRNQMKESKQRIDAMEAKLNGVEKKHTDFLSEQDNAEQKVEVKRISNIFKEEFGTLTDKEKKDGYKFISEKVSKRFETEVRNAVAANSSAVKSDDDFRKLVRDTTSAIHKEYQDEGEIYINDYLKKKGQVPKEKEKEPAKPDEKEKDPLGGKTFGEAIADEMFSEKT